MNLGKVGIIGLGYISSFLYINLSRKNKVNIFSSYKKSKFVNVKSIHDDIGKFNPFLEAQDSLIICSSFNLGGGTSNKKFENFNFFLERLIKFSKPKNVIYISSSSVYGTSKELKGFNENSPLNGSSKYALEKRNGENELKRLYLENLFSNCLILRPSNIFGLNSHIPPRRGLLNKLKKNIDEDLKLKLWGNYHNSFDFLHISDFLDIFINFMTKGFSNFEIYNVGSGKAVSLGEIFDHHKKNFSTKNIEVALNEEKIENNYLDISKLKNYMNYSFQHNWKSYSSN